MSKKILVVDDDSVMRLGYQLLLKSNHYETFFAADAMAAMSEARKCQPDLIILDMGLPAGDGVVVMERLKSNMHLAMVPVIVISSNDANKDRALAAGAKAFLQKPWKDEELLATIRQFAV